ncbi:A/G-specific adenine glycosylase [Isoptericola sp. b441]|uniref:Adenine DNA glycosylase n=1 Tax=Actinotalea lenta TaxID=3064654 RepID=A0ABT9D888_9CELL|nr:A/G-specific adenine glycosylase [Isoptericola sp. b441]MDO8106464.1 A/G-specific adenine glycosylase [Isoptericola sp. b441]
MPHPLVPPILHWFDAHRRDLPWRAADRTPWSVLVSEVMLQQTPVVRVLPVWRAWQERWPGPAELAGAGHDEVLRAWGRLGYPRRALRLHDCALTVVERHGGVLPADEAGLRSLPGIGEYTAAAVVAFAHGRRSVVLDTNVRRVLARALDGAALPTAHLTAGERTRAAAVVPPDDASAARWNAAVMELGALVCTARAPACTSCPVADRCAWLAEGRPPDALAQRRRRQGWHGTDRQARGAVMALLREAVGGGTVEAAAVEAACPDADQRERVLAGLLADHLVERNGDGLRLPRGPHLQGARTAAPTPPAAAPR